MAIFRLCARLAYESTFTVMDPISGTTLLFMGVDFKISLDPLIGLGFIQTVCIQLNPIRLRGSQGNF